jgi:uncharacterized membrane protein
MERKTVDVRTAERIKAVLKVLANLGKVILLPFYLATVLFCWPTLFCSWLADNVYPDWKETHENWALKESGPLWNALWLIVAGLIIAVLMIRGGYI